METSQHPPLHALIVEDSEFDARMLVRLLRQGGYDVTWQRVESGPAMEQALLTTAWNIVFADHEMPDFNAWRALAVLQQSGRDLPFIIVSGGIGEETAVALMKAGAHDFLIKGQLGRLVPAVERELREAANRAGRREAEDSLRESELRYRLLWHNSPDAILVMSAAGRIRFANPAAVTLFGYPMPQMIDREFTELVGLGVPGEMTCPWQGAETAGSRPLLELTSRTRGGVEVTVEIGFSQLALKDELWHVAFVRDITDRRRAESALRKKEEEFRFAREIQQRLFPKSAPDVPGFDVAGASVPADEAGGDLFDFLPMIGGGLGLVVADVCGHGMGPALIMAETRAYLRIVALNRAQPSDVISRSNRVLAEHLGDSNQFVTALLVRIDPQTRQLTFCNAGHPVGLVLDDVGAVKARLGEPYPPMGFDSETAYRDRGPVQLASGDTVILLTDGIEEAEGPDGGHFHAERAVEVVRRSRGASARDLVTAILAEAGAFSAGRPQNDDRTLVVVCVH